MTLPPRLLILLSLPALVTMAVFFVLPLAVLVGETGEGGGAAYLRLVDDPVFWQGLKGTLVLGTVAPALSVVVGFCVALHLARLPEGRRQGLLFLLSLPLTFSGLIVAYGFILVFGRAGFFTLLLAELGADPAVVGAMIFTPAGLGFAYCYYLIPRVVLVMLPVLVNFDTRQMDAAESLGAGRFAAFRDVLLPQVTPALIAAFCLTAAVAIGAYGTALALVGTQVQILPLLLFSKISETGADLPAAAAASVVLMAVCCAVMGLAEALGGLRRRG
ncbi:MAG: ABC transporter permease [Tistrella sp.]|jgi:putative spermidine/putrescine transport system permease protein|uniref:Spermidine/putrescine transport system permease protein n=2 Tax=Tistrella mobilis TaxID=171437 RepID=I3TXU5_TISMK|nr:MULTISPECIES: ABC transporter permease subunit [Tistrella]AFK57583.1 Spermidine/putrescine transport system permease protein [Tistrella mobilis KA081020-065]KYO52214.1 ABC transporter permease [Tistrella mobilis]MAD39166.1 ABC transporter permease [Tistrella sp.]MAM74558.1 ABC transporter permease [Tistrella sp.]MBA73756.1 ABC transporter permease [Tistrella sp.]